MAFWGNQDACSRFQSLFKSRISHSTNNSLHESDWNGFDIFGDIELRLLCERLQVLEDTIGMVVETSALYVTSDSPFFSVALLTWSLHQTYCLFQLENHL
jgi:hypothetical protein